MSTRDPGGGSQSALANTRNWLAEMKPRLIMWLLSSVTVLGVAGELFDPLGDALKDRELLGSSLFSAVALILFDAIIGSDTREASGVHIFDTMGELKAPVKEAFKARHVRIDFFGFTMETMLDSVKDSLVRLGDGSTRTRELTFRIIVAHLNSPMNLPSALSPAADGSGNMTFSDSPENRERMRKDYTTQNWRKLKQLLDEAKRRDPGLKIECEVRESPHNPVSKLLILNEEKAFQGTYGISRSQFTYEIGGVEQVYQFLDAEGFGIKHGSARVIGWDIRSKSKETQQIAEFHIEWFENLWIVLDSVKPAAPVIAATRWQPPDN